MFEFVLVFIYIFFCPCFGRFIAVRMFNCPEWDKDKEE